MHSYIVNGYDRALGAIGIQERWSQVVQANSESDAKEQARVIRYASGREHVHCYHVQLLKPENH